MKNEKLKKLSRSVICTAAAFVLLASSAAIPSYAQTPSYNNEVLAIFNLKYDPNKKTIEDKNGKGILGIGFDKDVGQNIYFSSSDCWQRNFGYSTFYDDMAPLFNMNFDSERYYFTYGGKKWLIQAWKGQYGITTGGEVGIYYKDMDRDIKHYDCVSDKDRLTVSITLYSDGKKMFTRPASKTWWQTGFVLFMMTPPENTGLVYSITFKDKAMLTAFKNSIQKNDKIKYSYKGLTVTCKWNVK